MITSIVSGKEFWPYLCHSIFHHLLIRHITLISHQQLIYTFCSVAINFLEPLLDVIERVHIGHVVDNADSMRAAVIRGCDGPEPFLASSVPLKKRQQDRIRWNSDLTICSFTVLPSSSIVRIFCSSSVSGAGQPEMPSCRGFLQNQLRWLKYNSLYKCRRRIEEVDMTFQPRSHRLGGA